MTVRESLGQNKGPKRGKGSEGSRRVKEGQGDPSQTMYILGGLIRNCTNYSRKMKYLVIIWHRWFFIPRMTIHLMQREFLNVFHINRDLRCQTGVTESIMNLSDHLLVVWLIVNIHCIACMLAKNVCESQVMKMRSYHTSLSLAWHTWTRTAACEKPCIESNYASPKCFPGTQCSCYCWVRNVTPWSWQTSLAAL